MGNFLSSRTLGVKIRPRHTRKRAMRQLVAISILILLLDRCSVSFSDASFLRAMEQKETTRNNLSASTSAAQEDQSREPMIQPNLDPQKIYEEHFQSKRVIEKQVFSQSDREELMFPKSDRCLYLETHEAPFESYRLMHGSLFRELSRQAFLLTAREEFDLTTVDLSLQSGKHLPQTKPPVRGQKPLTVLCLIPKEGIGFLSILERRGIFTGKTYWEGNVPISPQEPYCQFTKTLEELSRQDFVKVLLDLGYERREVMWKETAPVPDEISSTLKSWDLFSQFIGIRMLHEIMQSAGESPQRLAELSKAYARMSRLAESIRGTYGKVFMARALLYAERLIVRSQSSPEALWNRAYVRAVIGLPSAAQSDLEQADHPNQTAPNWLTELTAYCAGDINLVRERAMRADGDLAAFLLWQASLRQIGDNDEFEALTRMVELNPDSLYALIQTSFHFESLGTKRIATATAQSLPIVLRQALLAMKGLPKEVHEILESEETLKLDNIPKIVKLLKQAGLPDRDRSGVSWYVLAELVEETTFTVGWQHVDFLANWLNVPANDAIKQWLNALNLHSGAHAVVALGIRGEHWWPQASAYLDSLNMTSQEMRGISFIDRILPPDDSRYKTYRKIAALHSDFLVQEIPNQLTYFENKDTIHELCREMIRVAPHHPTTLVWVLEKDPEGYRAKLPEWETLFQEDGSSQLALGSAYQELGMFEEAERCLVRSVELTPSFEAYRRLAGFYSFTYQKQRWLESAIDSLSFPVTGLEHATLCGEIADYFLERGKLEEAAKYAELGADSGAAWAMMKAAKVCERQEDWDRAEHYWRTISQRYQSQADEWAIWCYRTGHGDREAALAYAVRSIESQNNFANDDDKVRAGVLLFLTEHRAKGYQLIREAGQSSSNPYQHWVAFIAAMINDDEKTRDEMLDRLTNREAEFNTSSLLSVARDVAIHLKDRIDKGRPGEIDLPMLDLQIAAMSEQARTWVWFFVGQYLTHCGREQDAVRYLELAAGSPYDDRLAVTMSKLLLERLKKEIPPRREFEVVPPENYPNESHALILRHDQPVLKVLVSKDSKTIETYDLAGRVRFWDRATGEITSEFSAGRGKLSSRGDYHDLLRVPTETENTAEDPGDFQLWSKSAGSRTRTYQGTGQGKLGYALFDQVDPQYFLCVYSRANSEMHPLEYCSFVSRESGAELWRHDLDDRVLFTVRFLRGEDQLWHLSRKLHSNDSVVTYLSKKDGTVLKTFVLKNHQIYDCELTSDGTHAVTWSLSGESVLWETENWQAEKRMWFPNTMHIAISDNRKYLLIGQLDGTILVCNLETDRIAARIEDHLQMLTQLQFVDDGQDFMSTSNDMTARLWNMQEVLANSEVAVDEPMPVVLTNSLGMSLAYIPSGEFLMGTSPEYRPTYEQTTVDIERAKFRHSVKISKPFFMSQYEVTVGQFREFVESTNYKTTVETTGKGRFYQIPHRNEVYSPEYTWEHPGFEQTDQHPVTQISWNDARAFCKWLSEKEQKTYRLPTEAEWEYACRAGAQGTFSYGPDYYENHTRYSNCCDASQLKIYNSIPSDDFNSDDSFPFTAPVGSFLPNAFGLFDMHGNVQEFCLDFYDTNYYQSSPAIDPQGPNRDPQKLPNKTSRRVARGGSFNTHYEYSRSAMRDWAREDAGMESYGFRTVLEIGGGEISTKP